MLLLSRRLLFLRQLSFHFSLLFFWDRILAHYGGIFSLPHIFRSAAPRALWKEGHTAREQLFLFCWHMPPLLLRYALRCAFSPQEYAHYFAAIHTPYTRCFFCYVAVTAKRQKRHARHGYSKHAMPFYAFREKAHGSAAAHAAKRNGEKREDIEGRL